MDGALDGPRSPRDFAWLVKDFAASTPGVAHALLVSSDGLPLIVSEGLHPDTADSLSAMTSGLLSLGRSIAEHVDEPGCDQIMLKFPAGHFLFMGIGGLAGLAVLVREGAALGAVAHEMTRLVESVGHVLTPRLRDDLRGLATGQGAS
ncbi:roadblock/LC7 domain-containing protein [Nocardiopsis sp. CNT-189]|uniref:roadblock/LC7 domain-containing protein n=1 Tax=Nocardiopsis TaxID=2013 RepID=UPI00034926A1|nr:roadblock/LC7 domain-containing protein [Nocardiopsis potens]